MLDAGVCGFMLKDCAFRELTDAIKSVMLGGIYLSSGIEGLESLHGLGAEMPKLTKRQEEILGLITQGMSSKQIAQHLRLTRNTVESHRKAIKQKLGIRSTAELTKYAIRRAITRS